MRFDDDLRTPTVIKKQLIDRLDDRHPHHPHWPFVAECGACRSLLQLKRHVFGKVQCPACGAQPLLWLWHK
jgi:hypothetical protein